MEIFSTSDVRSQNTDSLHIDSNHRHILNTLDAHLGWSSQKFFFVGAQFLTSPYLLHGDIGYDFFSNKYITVSAVIGWIPGITEKSSEISNMFFSFIYTSQLYSAIQQIYTLNVGWIEQQSQSIDYNFSAGAGIKVVSTLEKATFFLGIDFSIGYRFY